MVPPYIFVTLLSEILQKIASTEAIIGTSSSQMFYISKMQKGTVDIGIPWIWLPTIVHAL